MKLAFIGFRHGHLLGLYEAALTHPQVQVVAACEEDPAGAGPLLKNVKLTHQNYRQMLKDVECDAIAIGDYYSIRGQRAIEAMRAGKHVIADKPLCTNLADLDQIEALSRQKKLCVGCMLDMRGGAAARTVRKAIQAGAIGEVHTITFTAQHPLLYGSRPMWYFEPGKHGGTINDIAIHGIDALPWITGRRFVECVAARGWNARLKQHPDFQDGGQMMLKLDNGGGVLGDVSYLAPDASGYSAPQYWRITCHGADGVIESGQNVVTLTRSTDKAAQTLPLEPAIPHLSLESLLREITGQTGEIAPTTAEVLHSSRMTLKIQEAANTGETHVPLD